MRTVDMKLHGLLLVCLLMAHTVSSDGNFTVTQSQERGTFSGRFGFSDIAGVRSFTAEPEAEARIIGGQEAAPHSWPWQISLRLSFIPACGGAIIAPLWVISAAHCFKRYNKPSFWTVLAGKHDLDDPHEPEQQLVGVLKIFIHDRYNPVTKENDISLLKLDESLHFNTFVRPINVWMAPLPTFAKCCVTGWGSTRENGPQVNRLQEVNVTILSSNICNNYYSRRIRSSMFCAGRDSGGADACQGDSGGPLSCFTGSTYELAGVVSWGIGCGRASKPGVYTKVQDHKGWIGDILDRNMVADNNQAALKDRCGRKESSSCDQGPSPAFLSVSQEGELSVGNVTESCPNFWPWQVSLQSNGNHYCSGVLIDRRWVVTAKHCNARAKTDMVVLGVHELTLMSQTIPVDEVFDISADLSLLRLSIPTAFSSSVAPICLPDQDQGLDDSWSCVTAGWGATEVTENVDPDLLHHAGLTLVNQTSCQEKWSGLVNNSQICSHPAGSAFCMGDQGAPLFCQKAGVYSLFGVVTTSGQHCDADKPAIFTRISFYRSSISKITGEL